MKKYSKVFLIITMLLSSTIQADNNRFYSWSHWLLNFGRHATPAISILRTVAQALQVKYTITQLPDASDTVIQFCRERLQEHGINQQDILIKIRNECSLMEAFPGAIFFNPAAANQLNNVLDNPTDEESIRIIRVYSTFLDHEIAHLKNNDSLKRLAVFVSVSLASYCASSYLIKLFKLEPWFNEPQTLKEFFICYGAHGVLGTFHNMTNKKVFEWYSCYQEDNADRYAISCAKEPAALRATADCMEKFGNQALEFICGTVELSAQLTITQKITLAVMKKFLIVLYESEKPDEDLRSWAKKQSGSLDDMLEIMDPGHPNPFSRAKEIRAGADTLEASIPAIT